jgi:amino acid transporter
VAGRGRDVAGWLRRDLGTLESYATLVGILIGAGIFRVTTDAWLRTGSSVVLGYLVLAPVVLATSVPYMVFLSTPLGRAPGGEYSNIFHTFGRRDVAFLGAWLKIISYIGALAFLARTLADYALPATGETARLGLGLGSLAVVFAAHAAGVRWFGRLQVVMCTLLALSIAVLVVPGVFAVRSENYAPFFSGGVRGFTAALPLLFFAYAGFESLAQAAGEVRESTRRLPRVFLCGVVATTLVFVLMSAVACGVLPGERLVASPAPMTDVARVYLPDGLPTIVTLGALMAITTSLNATMLVPSRLALVLAKDGLAPAWLGGIAARTGTPLRGLTLTLAGAVALLVSRQVELALGIAVLALVLLYLLHGVALLALPRRNPTLYASRQVRAPFWLERGAACFSVGAMAGLVAVMVAYDIEALRATGFWERARHGKLTSIELLLAWGALGLCVYVLALRRGARHEVDSPSVADEPVS